MSALLRFGSATEDHRLSGRKIRTGNAPVGHNKNTGRAYGRRCKNVVALMTGPLAVVAVLAAVIGWQVFVVKLSGRPWWNPLWMAFTLTTVALLYTIAGVVGYTLPYHNPFITHGQWTGHIVWSRVEFG